MKHLTQITLILSLLMLAGCPSMQPDPNPCENPADCAGDDDDDDDDSGGDDDDSGGDDDDSAADDDDDDSVTPCDETTDPTCGEPSDAPFVGPGDYATWYWPGNHRPTETWPVVETVMHFLTGYYGMTFDEATGDLLQFGALADGMTAEEAQFRTNEDVESLPAASIRFEAGPASSPAIATTFEGASPTAVDRARMIDGGRFMNRIEIQSVSYDADGALEGRVEIASMPRHVVLNHTVSGSESAGVARVVLSGPAVDDLTDVVWEIPGKAVTMTDATGVGWLFAVYDVPGTTTSLTWSTEGLVAERVSTGAAVDGVTASLLAAPTTGLGDAERSLYLSPTLTVTYTLLNEQGTPASAPLVADWDSTLGAFFLPLRPLQDTGAPNGPNWNNEAFHNWYGRHRIEVDTGGLGPVSVPLAMHGTNKLSWYITGGAAMFRDAAGEPSGVPVQTSKNWHGEYWYHLYAQPTFVGGAPDTLELTMASSRWGEAYAASHAQLSLIGWGEAGGHWDESALGAFGESVTYDPDLALGRAMVDDVRPFLVQSDQMWNWTGNVGGANFLRYTTENEPYWQRRLSRVRSQYAAAGPNVTDVRYSGVTTDGKIEAEVRLQMGATDDLVRVWYHLNYTFLEDVAYTRLAFFQVAADNYGDNGFAHYAAGNADGVLFDLDVLDHQTTGYAFDSDRGIPLTGDSPWVMLYDNQRDWDDLPEHYANVGFVVRDFEADIGGTVITTPHINAHRTNNQNMSQMAFELGLPYEDGAPWCGAPCQGQTRFVPAGSTVTATVEYLIPPADKARYYGTADYLLALTPDSYTNTDMMLDLAAGNDLEVLVEVGTQTQTWPVEVMAIPGPVAAELTLTGGRGYTPMTFRGLNRHDGWRLEVETTGGWETVDQSVHGNDFWQADYDANSSTWSLTWSVANVGTKRYRLAWGAD